MSGITTHVLDTSRGKPAASVQVRLDRLDSGEWVRLGQSATDADGRAGALTPPGGRLEKGVHRLTFDTGSYFRAGGRESFYPEVQIRFEIADPAQHYHVPLLLSPFGYSTYRGS